MAAAHVYKEAGGGGGATVRNQNIAWDEKGNVSLSKKKKNRKRK